MGVRLLSRDGFNSANTTNINARVPDGDDVPAAATGEWDKLDVYGVNANIRIVSSNATVAGSYAVATVKDIPDIDSAEHAVEALVNFPAHDSPSGTSYNYCTRVKDKTEPGSGNPERFVDINDNYTVYFNGPLDPGTVVTVEDADSGGYSFKLYMEVQGDGRVKVFFDWAGPVAWSPFFGVPPQNSWTHREMTGHLGLSSSYALSDCCNHLRIERGATAPASGWSFNIEGAFGFDGFPGDPTGAGLTAPAFGGIDDLDLERLDTCHPISTGGEGDEIALVGVEVRADPTSDICYQLAVTFTHFIDPPVYSFSLWEFTDDGVRELASSSNITIVAAHDDPKYLALQVVGNVLYMWWDRQPLELENDAGFSSTFDLDNDLAWEDGLAATLIASGRPALAIGVGGVHSEWLEIRQFSVYGNCEDTSIPGGPGGGGGELEPEPPIVLVREFNAWREVSVDQLGPRDFGAFRTMQALPATPSVRDFNAWRAIAGRGGQDTNGDPGDGPTLLLCEDGTPDPPDEPLDPVGDRIFFCYGLPTSLLDPATPFDTLLVSFGSPSAAIREINASAAGGYRIYATFGGYNNYKLNDVYNGGVADDHIDSFAGAAASAANAAGPSGTGLLWGFSAFDDQNSRVQWGTTVPGTEVARIINRWKGIFTAVPVGVRLAPTLAIRSGGPLNADFYYAAFIASRGPVERFRDREVAAANSLGRPLIFALNVMNGGDGSSGIVGTRNRAGQIQGYQMSAAEVLEYGSVLCGAGPAGFGIWKYGAGVDGDTWFNFPNMQNNLAIVRNILTAAP